MIFFLKKEAYFAYQIRNYFLSSFIFSFLRTNKIKKRSKSEIHQWIRFKPSKSKLFLIYKKISSPLVSDHHIIDTLIVIILPRGTYSTLRLDDESGAFTSVVSVWFSIKLLVVEDTEEVDDVVVILLDDEDSDELELSVNSLI